MIMCRERNAIRIGIPVLLVLLPMAVWTAFGGSDYEQSIQHGAELEWSPIGIWVCRIPGYPFLFWRTVTPQDLTGQRYGGTSLQITYEINLPDPNETIADQDLPEQTVRTGPNSFESTSLIYATKEGEGPFSTVSHIWVCHAAWTLTSPDAYEGNTQVATYLASQDADGDGLPDDGQEPVDVVEFPVIGRRLRVMPPCEVPAQAP
jgi:hypothetical protein